MPCQPVFHYLDDREGAGRQMLAGTTQYTQQAEKGTLSLRTARLKNHALQ